MAREYRSIAQVQKTHGRKGEVVVVAAHGLPFLLREGMEVYVVPPALKGPRRRTVLACSDGTSGQLVSLSDVTTLDEASDLVGKVLLARVDDLPEDVTLHDAEALLGTCVCDERQGLIGHIEEVMRGPTQDVWVVRGELGETLVPVVAEFVRGRDSSGAIVVELPRGLVPEPEART